MKKGGRVPCNSEIPALGGGCISCQLLHQLICVPLFILVKQASSVTATQGSMELIAVHKRSHPSGAGQTQGHFQSHLRSFSQTLQWVA